MAKQGKKMLVPLANVVIEFAFNFARERTVETYDDPVLREDLATRGQITVAKLEKFGDTFKALQGNRRGYNMKILADRQVEDPKTCKRDDRGLIIPGTGKPFSVIEAEVYEGLSPSERVEIMLDHGNVRGLSKAELQLAFNGLFDVNEPEREIAIMLAGLLRQHYPPTREIKPVDEDKGADLLAYYRGVIQAAKMRYQAPVRLQEAAMQVLRGKQGWPTKAEIREGVKIHEEEVKADKSGKIDRETTGPKFNAWWDKLVKAKTADVADGGKPKPVSMMNRSQAEDLLKVADSRFAKWIIYYILRDERVSDDKFPVVCKLLKKAEKGEALSTEDQTVFDQCWNTEAVDPLATDSKTEPAKDGSNEPAEGDKPAEGDSVGV